MLDHKVCVVVLLKCFIKKDFWLSWLKSLVPLVFLQNQSLKWFPYSYNNTCNVMRVPEYYNISDAGWLEMLRFLLPTGSIE